MQISEVKIEVELEVSKRYNSVFENYEYGTSEFVSRILKDTFDIDSYYNVWTGLFEITIHLPQNTKRFSLSEANELNRAVLKIENYFSTVNVWMNKIDDYLTAKPTYQNEWEDEGDDYEELRPFKECQNIPDGIELIRNNHSIVKSILKVLLIKLN